MVVVVVLFVVEVVDGGGVCNVCSCGCFSKYVE